MKISRGDPRITAIVDAAARVTANDPRKRPDAEKYAFELAMLDLLSAANVFLNESVEELDRKAGGDA